MKARLKDTGEIIELAEEGIISCDGRRFCWYQVELIPEPIDECKPSIPSNLDEAAKKIVIQLHPSMEYSAVLGDHLTMGELVELVKSGAEWMAGQGASFNTKVGWIDGPTILDWPDDILDKFEMGDEVIVQIRNKQ